ncbi:MAG TPA: ROK family transcriptional regulator [Jiangellaceae bacterium]|nr:ROK family transcriptional regulator [Jiangellaceae bacterium]
MSRRPGTPELLRALNDRSAFEHLLEAGPLTRGRLGELTGLSKVTASQLVVRLQERGLIEVVGTRSGGRGPSAELYAVRPGCSYAVGVDMVLDRIQAAVAGVTGPVVAQVSRPSEDTADPLSVVHDAVLEALRKAGVGLAELGTVVIGTTGVVDPASGDVTFSFDLPRWHRGLREALHADLGCEIIIENDVNLAAIAEREEGAARDVEDMVLFWVGRGIGLAVVLGGRLQRGASGAAGEIGYLPAPGAPLLDDVSRRDSRGQLGGSLQQLVGAAAVSELAARHGIVADSAPGAVRAALAAGSPAYPFLDELAHRLAIGVASVCAVVDPALVVLAGEVGAAGDERLCNLVSDAVGHLVPVSPKVVATSVREDPVLRGALLTAVGKTRESLLASIAAS